MHLLASILSLRGPKASTENQAVSSLRETTYLTLGVYLYPAKSGLPWLVRDAHFLTLQFSFLPQGLAELLSHLHFSCWQTAA